MTNFQIFIFIVVVVTFPILIGILIALVQELLDLLFNSKKINEALKKGENFDITYYEDVFNEYLNKIDRFDHWDKEYLDLLLQKTLLDKQLFEKQRSKAVNETKNKILAVDLQIIKIKNEFIVSQIGQAKSADRIKREKEVFKIMQTE